MKTRKGSKDLCSQGATKINRKARLKRKKEKREKLTQTCTKLAQNKHKVSLAQRTKHSP